jgi:trimeric autotransporter adhesin
MKKIIVLFTLMTGSMLPVYSQGTTFYGVGAGTLGYENSYFGYQAGQQSGTSAGRNTAIGYQALINNVDGSLCTAVGAYTLLNGGEFCTAVGVYALSSNNGAGNIGSSNTAVGNSALRYNLSGDQNTAVGVSALQANQGNNNTAHGYYSLKTNNAGENNTATGSYSMYSNSSGSGNVSNGYRSLYTNTTGNYNTVAGTYSMNLNTSGSYNTANGYLTLYSNTTGYYNTASGTSSMYNNENGSYNTASGYQSLYSNTTGDNNTATGSFSLKANTSGQRNVANGYHAMSANTTGVHNTATGSFSLRENTTGYLNTANGYQSLYSNSTGYSNTALGSYAAFSNINGILNTAIGYSALYDNNLGGRNTAAGASALLNNTTANYNTAAGTYALYHVATGSYNSAFGSNAGPATDAHLENMTAIGYQAVTTASNQVRIGNTSVTSIGGEESWTEFSDGRFKRDVREDVSGLEFIKHLRPVSYVVDKTALNKFLHVTDSSGAEVINTGDRQTGFIAQEVEDLVKTTGYVFSGVDAPENENDAYGIRYAEFVVPLTKAVQELTAKLEEQEQMAAEQKQQIQLLLAKLEAKSEGGNNEARKGANAVLLQNNPNPFTSETELKMILPDEVSQAVIVIYSLEGRQVKNIAVAERGDVSVRILGNELSAGVYVYALIADGKVVDTRRMILTE